MQFLASLPTYGQDQAAKTIWGKLAEALIDTDGICYYQHPVILSTTKAVPDLTLLARGYQPAAIKICNFALNDIQEMT